MAAHCKHCEVLVTGVEYYFPYSDEKMMVRCDCCEFPMCIDCALARDFMCDDCREVIDS